MNAKPCPECGAIVSSTDPDGTCPGCGAKLFGDPRSRIRALEDLLARLRRDHDLPEDLVEEIRPKVIVRLSRLRQAERAGGTPPPAPPPIPDWARAAAPPPAAPAQSFQSTGPAAPAAPAATEPRPTKPPKPKREGPSIWERLGPIFAENLLFALAAFLIIAGAIYFVTTAWTTMSGTEKMLVVVGGIELLGLILTGAGYMANRGGTLPEVEKVLSVVVAYLVPVAAVPAGLLLRDSTLLGLLATAAVLGPGYFAARAAARRTEPALSPFVPGVLTGLALLAVLAPLGASLPTVSSTVVSVALLAAVFLLGREIVPRTGPDPRPVLWSMLLLGFAAAAATASIAIAAASIPPLGVVTAAIGGAALLTEWALARAGKLPSERSAPLLVAAIALAILGSVIALGDEKTLLAAALIGAATALAAGSRLPSPGLLLPGLVLAAAAYLKIPAPFREIALQVRDEAARELGYEPQALPLAWYGVTFIPYVAACGGIGAWVLRLGRIAHARVLVAWTLVASAGLVVLSLALMQGDVRAPACVLGAQGALLLSLCLPARSRWLALFGTLELYAGLIFGLIHIEASAAGHIAALAIAGLSALIASWQLKRSEDVMGGRIADSLVDATTALGGYLAIGLIVLTIIGALAGTITAMPGAPEFGDAPAFLALTALFAGLGIAFRSPVIVLVACSGLFRAVEGFLAGTRTPADWRFLGFAAAAAIPLAMIPLIEKAERLPARRTPKRPRPLGFLLPFGGVAVIAYGLLVQASVYPEAFFTGGTAVGLAVAAAVMAATALRTRQPWPVPVAVFLLALGGVSAAAAFGADVFRPGGLLGYAAATAITCGALVVAGLRERTWILARPLAVSITPMAAILLLWLCAFPPDASYRADAAREGALLAIGAFLAAAALRLSVPTAKRVLPGTEVCPGVASGIFFGFAVVGLLDALSARPDLYPVALVIAAVVIGIAARREMPVYASAGVVLLAALALTTGFSLHGSGAPWGLLAAFLMIAGAGRIAVRKAPLPGSLFVLLGALGAVSLAVAERLLDIDPKWQPAILTFFAAAAALSPRVPALRIERDAVLGVCGPILAGAFGAAAIGALLIAFASPEASVLPFTRGAIALASGGLIALAATFPLTAKVTRPAMIFWAVLLAAFFTAPLNALLEGGFARYWRPDVEVALLTVLLAAFVPIREKRSPNEARGVEWPYLLGAAALLLTALDVRDPSTPITFAVVTLVPFVLLVRDRKAWHAQVHGYLLLATGLSVAVCAVPESDSPAVEILPLLAAVSATVMLLLLWVAGRLRRDGADDLRAGVGDALARVAGLSAGLAVLCVGANVLVRADYPAPGILTGLAAYACLAVAAIAGREAFLRGRPVLVHAAVGALLALYGFLALRTDALDVVSEYHLHVLLVFGTGLLHLSGSFKGHLRLALAIDGLLLTVPAVIMSLPALVGDYDFSDRAPAALFLAATAYGTAAYRFRNTALGWISVVTLNLAVFTLWRRHGIVDPSFYGVPAGLTLMLGSELLRKKVAAGARLALFVPGVALLYGSVGIQVLRVDAPTHALALFAGGLLTVTAGFLLDRNRLLVVGTSVVVLDVVAYLARHGFEEGFLGAALLVLAGLTVLTVATLAAARRRRSVAAPNAEEPPPDPGYDEDGS